MTDKKSNKQHHKNDEQHEHHKPTHTDRDLIEYDPEKAQDMIDVEEATEHASQVNPPGPDDPQRPDEGVPPNQENVPEGFTTGRGMQGGSANRRKR
jgi:hypothetical protein